MRTISEIIKAAGGARGISEATEGAVKVDAIYKWQTIGVPDRHWPILIQLGGSSPDELFEANRIARSASEQAA